MAATVKYGSKGDDVSQLQTMLNQNGFSLTVDGIFGDATQAAVKQYQQKSGLSVDGIAGANTWGALTGGGSGGSGGGSTGNYYNPATGQMMPAGWTPESDGGGSGGFSVSGVSGNPNFTFSDLQNGLNLNTYTPRTADELLREAQNYYDPIYNQTVESTQQAHDRIMLALDQQAAGLDASYNKQRESTADAFAKTYSQADRQALGRGMQRSSYNAQTLSNIGIAGARAQDDINTAQRQDETNIGQNRVLQQEQLAQTLSRLETDYTTNIAAYQDQLKNLDYDRAWQSQQAANEALLNLYQLSLQQYQFERQLSENARQFNASLAASGSSSGGGGGATKKNNPASKPANDTPSVEEYVNSLNSTPTKPKAKTGSGGGSSTDATHAI